MKTFKQFIQPTDALVAEGMYDDLKHAVGNALETGAKKTVEFKKNAGSFVKGVMGDAESIPGKVAATAWELLDPTGISSWDDTAEALLHYRSNPSTLNFALYLLNLVNCIPNIPLFVSVGATAAGAVGGAGIGAIPGAVASAGSEVGVAAARGGIKFLIKSAEKHPDKVIKAAEEISKLVSRSPAAVEAATKVTKELGATSDELAALEKSIGKSTGVELKAGTPSPKGMDYKDYKALSAEDKAKIDGGFAKKAADETTKLAKEIDNDPIFKKLVDDQKLYRSQEGNADYGIENTLKYIVAKSDDKLIGQSLDSIAIKNGTTKEKVIDAIKAAHPSIKFPEAPTPTTATKALKGLEDLGEIGAKTGEKEVTTIAKTAEKEAAVATKTAEKGAEAAGDVADAGKKFSTGTKVAARLATGATAKAWMYKQAAARLAANILNPLKQKADQLFKPEAGGSTALGTAGASPEEVVDFTTSDGKKIKTTKQSLKDIGLVPLQAPEPTVYTYGGKVLTPAQAAALGSFATPARYNSQTKKWEEIKNVIRPGQQIMNPDGSSPEEVNATSVVPYDKESKFNELEGAPEIGAKDKEQSLRTGRIVTQNIPQGATEKNPLGREGMSASEYTKPDKFNNPPMTFDDIFKSIFGP